MKNGKGRLEVDLLHGSILKGLLVFAIPLFISNVFQQFYNAVDTMIVGNYLGDVSLAAIGACGAVYELLIGFALGMGNGLSIVAARYYGAHNEEFLKKSVAGSLAIGAGITLVLMLVSHLFLYPLLELLGTPSDIIEESYSYISMIALCVGVMFAYNLLAGLLRAVGNSVMPLVFLVLSALLNIGLDLLFITRFEMGIRGAAIATVIAQGVSAVLCLIYILKKCPILIPRGRHFAAGARLYKELLGQGLSMGLMTGIVATGTVILQAGINNLGYLIIAGHTAARKLHSFCLMPFSTLSLALSTFVSQNRGAGQIARIRRGVRYANMLSVCWGALLIFILGFGAEWMIQLLSGSSESVVLENGARYLRIGSPFYMVLGVLLNTRNSLQGLGSKLIPLISSVIEFVGKILFVMIMIPKLGYLGVILCEPVIWCFMTMQLVWAFYHDATIQKARGRQQ
ncbi:MAG: MATE family efflux transporter [Lachnospiraceae bacterium]|nr:MATE family efflux transporter [Lachnospiraceae bacterium]